MDKRYCVDLAFAYLYRSISLVFPSQKKLVWNSSSTRWLLKTHVNANEEWSHCKHIMHSIHILGRKGSVQDLSSVNNWNAKKERRKEGTIWNVQTSTSFMCTICTGCRVHLCLEELLFWLRNEVLFYVALLCHIKLITYKKLFLLLYHKTILLQVT